MIDSADCWKKDEAEELEGTMPSRIPDREGLFEVVLLIGGLASMFAFLMSEAAFTITIFFATVFAITVIVRNIWQ